MGLIIVGVESRRMGAPICAMVPGHGEEDTGGATFAFTAPDNYTAGESYSIEVATTSDRGTFRGFVVTAQAVSVIDASVDDDRYTTWPEKVKPTVGVGMFIDHTADSQENAYCSVPASATTHADGYVDKTSLTLTWVAPDPGIGPVVFYATVVVSINDDWQFIQSTEVAQVLDTVVPAAPTDVEIADASNETISIAWAPSGTNGPPVTDYTLYARELGSGTSGVLLSVAVSSDAACDASASPPCVATLSGLTPDRAYAMNVSATNTVGEGAPSQISAKTLTTGATKPNAPDAPIYVNSTSTSITLSLSPPELNGAYVTEYGILITNVKENDPFVSTMSSEDVEMGLVVVEDLHPKTEYEISLIAYSFEGASDVSEGVVVMTKSDGECPDECSGNGQCESGICFCDHSWLGKACERIAWRGCFDEDKLCVAWALDHDESLVYVDVTGKTAGWAALIVDGSDKMMTNGDAWIAFVDEEGSPMALDAWSTGFVMPEVDGTSDDLAMIGGQQNSTHTRVQFVRPFDTDDASDKPIKRGMTPIAWAISGDPAVSGDGDDPLDGAISKHLDSSRGTGAINWYTGAVVEDDAGAFVIVHAALMLSAWALCAPLGVALAARARMLAPGGDNGYFRTLAKERPEHSWLFKAHRGVQSLCLLLTLAAVVTIMCKPGRTTPTVHMVFGYFTLLGGIAQPLIAIFFHSDSTRSVHRVLGRSVLGAALMLQIPVGIGIAGFSDQDTTAKLLGVWALYVVMLCVAYASALAKASMESARNKFYSPPAWFDAKTRWQDVTETIDFALKKNYYTLGVYIARRPCAVIWCMCLVTVVNMAGFMAMRPDMSLFGWLPQGTPTVSAWDYYDKYFTPLDSDEGNIMFVAKDPGANILTKQTLFEMLELFNKIENLQVDETLYEDYGSEYCKNWNECCWRMYPGATCSSRSVLDFWKNNFHEIDKMPEEDIMRVVSKRNVLYDELGQAIVPEDWLGGATYDPPGSRNVSSVPALMISLSLHPVEDFSYPFQYALIDMLKEHPNDGAYYVQFNVEASYDEELGDAILGDILLFVLAFLTMILFSAVVMGPAHPLRGKIGIAFGGIGSIFLGLLTGLGFSFMSTNQYLFNSVHAVIPLIILSIGIDDMFVLAGAYVEATEKYDHIASVSADGIGLTGPEEEIILQGFRGATRIERIIGRALGEVGASVTMTTATDFAAFWVGIFSAIPVIRSFCYFCAVCVLSDFLLQSTFFIAVLALDARREEVGRVDCCCCFFVAGYSTAKVAVSGVDGDAADETLAKGGALPTDIAHPPAQAPKRRKSRGEIAQAAAAGVLMGGSPDDSSNPRKIKVAQQDHDIPAEISASVVATEASSEFAPIQFLVRVVLSPVGRTCVLVSALILFAVGCIGAAQLKVGMESSDLFKKTSCKSRVMIMLHATTALLLTEFSPLSTSS
jgi:hypothetical protein